MSKPLAIDLCCGLGGWTEGLLAEGYRVIGYDIEAHEYDGEKYPGELRLENVLRLCGAQFHEAALIVASPPCQEFSYMAMPWSRAKQIARALRFEDEFPENYKGSRTHAELTAIFDACYRIQREASAVAGRHIPLILENVKGAQPWVGPAKWSYGSYYLWGDVPALMPHTLEAHKNPGFRFDGSGRSFQSESVNRHVDGLKAPGGAHRPDGAPHTAGLTNPAEGRKNSGGSWFKVAHNTTSGVGANPDGRHWQRDPVASCGSKSPKRKAASAKIAKIPFALSSWIARTYKPTAERAA